MSRDGAHSHCLPGTIMLIASSLNSVLDYHTPQEPQLNRAIPFWGFVLMCDGTAPKKHVFGGSILSCGSRGLSRTQKMLVLVFGLDTLEGMFTLYTLEVFVFFSPDPL